MERRARKLHWNKKKTIRYESRKVEEKKYRALRPVSDEKKLTWPVRRKQIYTFFGLIECSQLILCSKVEMTTGLIHGLVSLEVHGLS